MARENDMPLNAQNVKCLQWIQKCFLRLCQKYFLREPLVYTNSEIIKCWGKKHAKRYNDYVEKIQRKNKSKKKTNGCNTKFYGHSLSGEIFEWNTSFEQMHTQITHLAFHIKIKLNNVWKYWAASRSLDMMSDGNNDNVSIVRAYTKLRQCVSFRT